MMRALPFLLAAVFAAACAPSTEVERPEPVAPTFAEHIAPIVHTNCAPCHRPGGSAPFQLIEYADLRKRTRMIELVTRERIMPPWPADPDYRHFLGERLLTDEQIALIGAWVEAGSPPGDTSRAPEPPLWPEASSVLAAELGPPDLVLDFPRYEVPGVAEDRFLFMKIPFELPEETFVRAIEFVPGNRQLGAPYERQPDPV